MTENNTKPETNMTSPDGINQTPKKQGKLIFNIIIILALIVLYVLFFYSKGDNKPTSYPSTPVSQINTTTSNVIAFVNTDVIMEKYDLVIDMKERLSDKMKRMEGEIQSKQSSYEKDANYFQEQVAKNSLSEKSAQLIYEKLMEEQQKLIDLRDTYTEQLAMDEYEMNVVLVDSITNFLQRYNLYHNYDYVLGYSKGGGILLAKDTFNITAEILTAMNEEYFNKIKK